MNINSPTGICNLALSLLGIAPVTNIEEPQTVAEKILNGIYDTARQNIYNDCYFQFSMDTILLPAELIDDIEYPYTVKFPPDFLKMVRLYKNGIFIPNNGKNFRIQGNRIVGSYLNPPFEMLYVRDVKDVNEMTGDFKLLFASNIARLCGKRLGSVEGAADAENLYEKELLKARSNNGIDNPPMVLRESDYLDSWQYPRN
jgi:hypothetical protein